MYNKKQSGSVIAEFLLVSMFFSLVLYFALVGNPRELDSPELVNAVHDRQGAFIESVLAP